MIRYFISSVFLLSAPLFGHDSLVSPPYAHVSSEESLSGHIHLGWESRYFTEGRDALDGDSLAIAFFELVYENLAFGTWYGISQEQDYDELQLSVAYANEINGVDYYFSYTHFEFFTVFSGSENDDELGLGFSYGDLPQGLELALDAYYSFEADGYFAELSLAHSTPLSSCCSFNNTAIFGMNQGYVAEGHDGANHFALRSELAYELSESWSLSVHGTYSWAIDRDDSAPDDALLKDFFHGGVDIGWSF